MSERVTSEFTPRDPFLPGARYNELKLSDPRGVPASRETLARGGDGVKATKSTEASVDKS